MGERGRISEGRIGEGGDASEGEDEISEGRIRDASEGEDEISEGRLGDSDDQEQMKQAMTEGASHGTQSDSRS